MRKPNFITLSSALRRMEGTESTLWEVHQPAFNKLLLKCDEFPYSSQSQRIRLIELLSTNTTITYLDLRGSAFDIEALAFELRSNYTLTALYYNKEEVSDKIIDEIDKLIQRNRDITFSKGVSPKSVTLKERAAEYQRAYFSNKHPKTQEAYRAFMLAQENLLAEAFKAAKEGDINLLYTLLGENKELLNISPAKFPLDESYLFDKYPSLLHAAAGNGHIDCVKWLLTMGEDIDFSVDRITFRKGPPLYQAVKQNHFLVVKYLIENGANIHRVRPGVPLLHVAQDLEMVKYLISQGLDIFEKVKSVAESSRHCSGNTILHSILHGSRPTVELLEFLIQQGCDINATNDQGETPIFSLMRNKQLQQSEFPLIFNYLVRVGAKLEHKNNQGKTPLKIALSVTGICYFYWIPNLITEATLGKLHAPASNIFRVRSVDEYLQSEEYYELIKSRAAEKHPSSDNSGQNNTTQNSGNSMIISVASPDNANTDITKKPTSSLANSHSSWFNSIKRNSSKMDIDKCYSDQDSLQFSG